MPRAPRGVRISYGPSLAPVDSGIRLIEFSVADREAVKSCVTAHPEIGRLPESAFRAPQHLPIPVHWTESGLLVQWHLATLAVSPPCPVPQRCYGPVTPPIRWLPLIRKLKVKYKVL